MKISILTAAPEQLAGLTESHTMKRAQSLGLLELSIVDVRDYADGSFRAVDDSPYGGGPGMVLRVEPVFRALDAVRGNDEALVIAMTPEGRKMDQQLVRALAGYEPGKTTMSDERQNPLSSLAPAGHLVILCGHYEGFDERIFSRVDMRVSLGDFILTGGEIPAMALTDAVVRLLPGVLKKGSAEEESFENDLLDYPQYTHPAEYEGMKVPEVLLSGNHEAIAAWRKQAAIEKTRKFRPDLLRDR